MDSLANDTVVPDFQEESDIRVENNLHGVLVIFSICIRSAHLGEGSEE
jgi:hypothetical protein